MFRSFATVVSSISLEGIFFILIGVFISGLIAVFITEDHIRRFIPKNKIIGLLAASMMGVIFPICECGIVPVVSRLLKKGVPLHLCITMLFASPIVNIVVMLSTYYAFRDFTLMVVMRILGGFIISISVGLFVSLTVREEKVIKPWTSEESSPTCCSAHGSSKLSAVLNHSIEDFFDTGKYFIIGIIITALIKTTVPGKYFLDMGNKFPASNIFMLFFPYILSVCSNTDAFIARTFYGQFNVSAIICFLVFGAMFDIKTTLMLKKIFRTGFVLKLLLFVASATLLYSFAIEYIFLKGC